MDDRTLRVLEYEKVKELLAAQADSSLGKAHAVALEPMTSGTRVSAALAETTQARRLLERGGRPPTAGLTDVGPLVARARLGGILQPEELLRLADFLRCARRMAAYLTGDPEAAPRLHEIGTALIAYPDIEAEIDRCVDENGSIRRHASDELARLSARADILERRVRERVEAVLRREMERGVLQEPLIVQRAGRFCLPVQAGAQSRFQGIIHDRSDSGATVFMEPLEVVEIGNELRETGLEIEAEVERILRGLSARIGAVAAELESNLRALGLADFILARARLAQAMGACEPELVREPAVRLHHARHPLLKGNIVPVDIWVGDEFDTLIITGPNTGGKTVALKTVGLLSLMAQSGLHVPADPGSRMPVWEHIYADIGDEQSIEQSLSTFSSHMTQIVKIVNRVAAHRRNRIRHGQEAEPPRVLVLLDEIGAGTDPSEGAALARAVLDELREAGCRTIVTTHFNDLKAYAYATPRVENASVQFDVRTLQPTYKLLIGHAGSSNAFHIAQRLGLPRSIVNRARQYLGEERLRFEDVVGQVEQQRRVLHERTREAASTQRDLEKLRQHYEAELAKLEQQRRAALERGFAEAEAVLTAAQNSAREIIARLQRQPRQSKVTQQLRTQLEDLKARIQSQRQEALPEETVDAAEVEPGLPQVLLGDPVHVPALGRDGRVIGLPRPDTAQVQVGTMTVECPLADLRPPTEQISPQSAALAEKMQTRKEFTVPREIDLRGKTVDEALLDLERYLDDVALARFPQVRIIHGKGTGALRRGIHDFLRRHPQVRSFQLAEHEAGGEGATVVCM